MAWRLRSPCGDLLRLRGPLSRAAWHARGCARRFQSITSSGPWPTPSASGSTTPDHPGLEVDCYFPAHRVVIETDGWETHRTRQAFEDDRAKDAALTAAGYTVVRFTWRQLRDDPPTVADRIKAILRPRGPASPPRARGGPARA
jgi:hypothetical protein